MYHYTLKYKENGVVNTRFTTPLLYYSPLTYGNKAICLARLIATVNLR